MYRKYQAEQLFTGREMLDSTNVLICDASGKVADIVHFEEAGDGIQKIDGIVCPGFVNAHCHLELSHLKGRISKHTGLINFIGEVMRYRSGFEMDEIESQMRTAEEQMRSLGIAAVGDICNTANSIRIKKDSAIAWYNFIEVAGFIDAGAQARYNEGAVIQQAFLQNNLKASITPHAPYSVSKTLFKLISHSSVNELITIHNQETAAENELYQHGTGGFLKLYESLGIDISKFEPTQKTSLQSWVPLFDQHQRIISVHNSFIEQEDIEFATTRQLYYCVCINANLYIENKVPPIDLMVNAGEKMLIGTDSLASNDTLDMMAEIGRIQEYFPHISLPTLLQWATLNGAEALGIQDRFGSFEKG